jgi:hypothetical protein
MHCFTSSRLWYPIKRKSPLADSEEPAFFVVVQIRGNFHGKSGKGYPTLHLHVHITGAKEVSDEILHTDRRNFESVFDQIAQETCRAFVITCGPRPAAMVNQVWDLSIRKSLSNVRFDFHHEIFEF